MLGFASLHILASYYQPLNGALAIQGNFLKYFTIIALLLSFNSFTNIFGKINCGSYEPTKYPNKKVFKGTVKSEVTEVGVKEFFETAQNDSKQIMWKLELLDRATGKYKKSFPRTSPYSDEQTAIEHQIILIEKTGIFLCVSFARYLTTKLTK